MSKLASSVVHCFRLSTCKSGRTILILALVHESCTRVTCPSEVWTGKRVEEDEYDWSSDEDDDDDDDDERKEEEKVEES